jgi:outer membrane murein-binding lipoprotein Lpp
VSENGIQVGPHAEVTTEDGQFGAGMSTFGPSVIVGGVSVPVLAPQVGVANVVVAGLSKAYNAVADKREKPIKELKTQIAQLEAEKAQFKADLEAMKAPNG